MHPPVHSLGSPKGQRQDLFAKAARLGCSQFQWVGGPRRLPVCWILHVRLRTGYLCLLLPVSDLIKARTGRQSGHQTSSGKTCHPESHWLMNLQPDRASENTGHLPKDREHVWLLSQGAPCCSELQLEAPGSLLCIVGAGGG